MSGRFEVVPSELPAAAQPVREAAAVLDEVADRGRELTRLVGTAPSHVFRDAVRDCLRSYELATWELAEETAWLAQRLADAAGHYAHVERSTAEGQPQLTPRGGRQPRTGPVHGQAPTPQAAPAPVPPR